MRIDTQNRTAQFGGATGDCKITASAGVSTRCTGANFTVEYDDRDFRWATLDNTWLSCEPEP